MTDAMLNPELTLQQKAYRTRISYRFFDSYVEYTIVDSRGDKASFNTKYEDLPPKFDYRTFEPRKPVVSVQIFTLMALTLVLILLHPKDSLLMIAFMAVYGGLIVGLSLWVRRRWFRKMYTSVPSRNGKILVLRNTNHDAVMQELESRRLKALRKFAMIDALNAPMAEYRRLKWLKEEGAITPLEFDNFRRALGPSVGGMALSGDDAIEAPPLKLDQDVFRFHASFAFHGDYLDYAMNDGALTEFKAHYKDLPHPSEYRSFAKKDGLLTGFILCFAALLATALMNFVEGDHYFSTPAGSHQALIGILIFVPAIAILAFGARRVSRKEYTIVPISKGVIRILNDAQHERIVGEIQNRRLAALRAQAVIDGANSMQGELRKFTWLKEQGVISAEEFEGFRERIMDVMQERSSQPSVPPKPPTETLH